MKRHIWLVLGVMAAMLLWQREARCWDHRDGNQTPLEIGGDITDLYAWVSADGARVNLILNVTENAAADATFPPSIQYVFHTASRPEPQAAEGEHPLNIVCTFDDAQLISCWAGRRYVNGDASVPEGIATKDGKLRVFAGTRNDPFFMNKLGWDVVAETVHRGNRAVYEWDGGHCPYFTAERSQRTMNELRTSDERGSGGFDYYQSYNVQSIVLSVDKSLLTVDGPIVSVWASTHRAP